MFLVGPGSNLVHRLRRGLQTWKTRAHGNTDEAKVRFGVELLRPR